ncbi:Ycf66 family protein [Leptothermofonsia sp. ETS-13]|uniref:Ycf66 family protein n=1 Tax=Leptothermofonsia sp. ETS-13 TaxID=3035696 RepID=UPI003BA13DB2
MLAYLLALVVGLGSFALYMAAFFFPEIHRKNDFIWSGVGLFYALVLWVCAERIRGGLLLGQTASVALLGWLGWQTLMMRRQVTPLEEQTALPSSDELKGILSNLSKPETFSKLSGQVVSQFEKLRNQIQDLTGSVGKPKVVVKPELDEPYIPLTPEDFASARRKPMVEAPVDVDIDIDTEETIAHVEEAIADAVEQAPSSEMTPGEAFETLTEEASDQVHEVSEQIGIGSSKAARDVKEAAYAAAENTTKSVPPLKEKATSVFAIFSDVARGLFKKKESKPTYVRKQFRQSTGEVVLEQKVSPEGLDEPATIHAELVNEETIVEGIADAAIAETIATEVTEVMEKVTEKESFPSVEELFEAETPANQTSEIDSTDALIEGLLQEKEPVTEELSLADQSDEPGSADAAIAGLFQEEPVTEELSLADQSDELGSADAAIAGLFQEEPVTEELSLANQSDELGSADAAIAGLFQEEPTIEETLVVEETLQFEPESAVDSNLEEAPEATISENLLANIDTSFEAQSEAILDMGSDIPSFETETISSAEITGLFQEQSQEQSEVTSETGFDFSFASEETPAANLETSEIVEESASGEDEILKELAEADLDSDLDMPFDTGETAPPEVNSLFQKPLEEPLEISPDLNLEIALANLEEGSVDEVSDGDSLFEESPGIGELSGITPDTNWDDSFNEAEDTPPATEMVSSDGEDISSSEREALLQEESEAIPDLSSESSSPVTEEALFPNIDGLFQEQSEKAADFSLESSSNLVEEVTSDIDAFFEEQNKSHLPMGLENPFAEAIAEQPILTTDLLAEESAPLEDFNLEGRLPSETVAEDAVQGVDIEIQFEPEGTIDLNNLEGLFDDVSAEGAGLDVENLFPENTENFDLSLEDAFKDSDRKPEGEG